MRPNGVVVPSPGLDDDLGFTQRIEDLSVEQFVPQTSIEAFNVAVLPMSGFPAPASFDLCVPKT
jgi:hypothetical protein